MHHIKKMHCQQFTLKITLACQNPLGQTSFIGPSIAAGPRNNVPAGPPLIGPGCWRALVMDGRWYRLQEVSLPTAGKRYLHF